METKKAGKKMEKRLYRARTEKIIAGIAAGLGKYLDIDPILIRIVIVLITIFHGVGFIIYVALWIIIPEEPIDNLYTPAEEIKTGDTDFKEYTSESVTENDSSSKGRIIVGIILIGLGLVFLLEKFLPFFDFDLFLAIVFIVLGIALVTNFYKK